MAGLLAAASPATAQTAFTAGNVVIYQAGDGAVPLSNLGSPVFISEFNNLGTFVPASQVAMPTTVAGSNRQLICGGTATSEGLMNLSTDGRFLTMAGYATNLGGATALSGSSSAVINRSIGRVDSLGVADTSTALTNYASGTTPRGVITNQTGTQFWLSSGLVGVQFANLGSTSASTVSTTNTNQRAVGIVANQLYMSAGAGSVRMGAVGTGTPTGSGQTAVQFPGVPITNTYNAFQLLDLNPAIAGVDTLYIADETADGIQKFSFDGTTWTNNGLIAALDVRGLTSSVTPGPTPTVTLYGTTGASSATGGGSLYQVTDTAGHNAAPSNPATTAINVAGVGSNIAYRGVAFAPAVLTWNTAVTSGTWDNETTANFTNNAGTGSAAAANYFSPYAANFGATGVDIAITVPAIGVHTQGGVNITNTSNTYTFSGGPIQGTGGVRKSGAGGAAVLTADSTYSGGTTVSSGILRVSNTGPGSGTGSGTVTITGGTLQGTGRVGGQITLQSGNLRPGNASGVGTLTTATQPTFTGGIFNVNLAALGTGNHGQLNITAPGDVNIGNSTIFAFTSYNGATDGPFTIVQTLGSSVTGRFSNYPSDQSFLFANPGTGVGYAIYYGSFPGSPGQIVVAPVPEPALVLVACAAGLCALRLRRKFRPS